MHEYIAQPGASGGLAGASIPSKQNQPTANSTHRLAHRNSDTPDSTILGGHKVNLQRQIRAAQRSVGAVSAPPYHREVFMVTGRQYEQHDRTKGREHHIQPPVIQIPDSILVE
jgi:hypothetical protein